MAQKKTLKPTDLPETLPIFPLAGALLLPGGELPLNVFEDRYKALVEQALGKGRVFGMIQSRCPDDRPDHDPEADIYTIGCLGKISSFSETEDGRYLVTLKGINRFKIISELDQQDGYRRVTVSYDGYLEDLDYAPCPNQCCENDFFCLVKKYFEQQDLNANWDYIKSVPFEHLVTNLSMICPFTNREKQALLEAENFKERCQKLTTMLQFALQGCKEKQAQ